MFPCDFPVGSMGTNGIPNTLDARTFDTNNFGGAFDADEENDADIPNEFKE